MRSGHWIPDAPSAWLDMGFDTASYYVFRNRHPHHELAVFPRGVNYIGSRRRTAAWLIMSRGTGRNHSALGYIGPGQWVGLKDYATEAEAEAALAKLRMILMTYFTE